MAGERIELQGLTNTRDLGGYKTEDGGVIRPKRILRSGALATATPEDIHILTNQYRLKRIIDFRTEVERRQKPDPEMEGVDYVENGILHEAQMGITHEGEERPADLVGSMIAMCREVGKEAGHYLLDLYPLLVTDPYCLKQYRHFFDLLLAQENGSTLYHCSEGKDRVGTATALLLSALGVNRDIIMDDYLLTNHYSEEKRQYILNLIRQKEPDDTKLHERFLMLNSVQEDYLASIFSTVEARYGSMERFLEQQMGLDAARRERLKRLYLE